ncbi:MAG: glycogen debranching protein [Nitrospira bacterium SG8_35_1]|nr:MAG: glycogen debranching protein [Nitrospira bacterium SG8_35_1]
MKTRSTMHYSPGHPLPFGATFMGEYTQFSLFSRHATGVCLQFFKHAWDESPESEIDLDPAYYRTGDVWHVAVQGIQPGCLYGYRIDGPYEPDKGHRYNRNKLLVDPYAKAVTGNFNWSLSDARGYDIDSQERDLSFSTIDSAGGAPKCVVVHDTFNWGRDRHPRVPLSDTIIYELHVKGFTAHSSSSVTHPGTFRGIIDKIPYFKELGITAVELMPIHEFDEDELVNTNPLSGERLKNFWGYNTINFFAPRSRYCSSGALGQQVDEFKQMVKALHKENIEVILDVVFNHTAEGNEMGPTICFRGIDNSIYYMLEKQRYYKNYSGCGNSMNCNHPIVQSFIMDCLIYWVLEMHVDGFRFDLASVLGRDSNGNVLENPPILNSISENPLLRDTKIIAEAWDAAGLYQVGSFPGERWAEWNGKYRDDVRSFWRGDEGCVSKIATRISGSSDLYEHAGKRPFHSINFITCHDGFPMNDLVSYRHKHNSANGEDSRDGTDHNISANYGVEGPTEDNSINELRERQMKNFMVTLMLSQGVPMMLAGDEFKRTQNGNNNAYCQDNEISWINWEFAEQNHQFLDFVTRLIKFRKDHPVFRRGYFFQGKDLNNNGLPDIKWLDKNLKHPDWKNHNEHSIAFYLDGSRMNSGSHRLDNDFFIIFNSGTKELIQKIPAPPAAKAWYVAIDTSLIGIDSFSQEGKEPAVNNDVFLVKPRSSVVLLTKPL